MITEQCTKGLEDNPEACRIRQAVFVDEQGFHNEFDEIDPEAWHVVLWEDGARLRPGACSQSQGSDGVWTIGRVAVLKPYRGKGLGALVVQKLEQVAPSMGPRRLSSPPRCGRRGSMRQSATMPREKPIWMNTARM